MAFSKTCRSLLLITAAAWTANAAAEDPCLSVYEADIRTEADLEPVNVLGILRGDPCVLGTSDTTQLNAQYRKLISTKSPTDIAIERGLLLEKMLADLADLPTSTCDDFSADCTAGRHLKALETLQERVQTSEFNLAVDTRDQWALDPSGKIKISDFDAAQLFESECAVIDSSSCADAVSVYAKSVRTASAANEVITSHARPVIGVNERFLSSRDKEWEAYLNGDSVQFPWELAFNSWRFSKTTQDKDQFPRAPEYQWVILHPSPAVELIDSPDDDNETHAAIVVEVFGYQRWKWQNGAQHMRWGASAVVSLANINGMDTMGYGVMLHTPVKNTSLGVIWRDSDNGNEVGLVLNINLANLLNKYGNSDLTSFLNL